jgi:N12 class adenine-specific DNA methylase
MNIDLFIVSFSRDSDWFRRSLEVNRKNLTGFRQIVLMTPHQDRELFQSIVAGVPNLKHVRLAGPRLLLAAGVQT